jgi:cell division protein FtsL
MKIKISLILLCFLIAAAFVIVTLNYNKRQTMLTRENQKLIIQKDSLLSEKMEYENRFVQLLQQFDTIVRKKILDSTVIFIPKTKKGKLTSVKKTDVFK